MGAGRDFRPKENLKIVDFITGRTVYTATAYSIGAGVPDGRVITRDEQLMFGLVLGARYERAFFARHKLFIPFALLNSFLILITSVAVAVALAWAFELPIATMIIATAPGDDHGGWPSGLY